MRRAALRVGMQRASLRRKLIAVSMGTTTVALLVACALLIAYDAVTFHASQIAALETLADTVASGSAGAISFDDPPTAREALEALAAHHTVQTARIHTSDGHLFVAYDAPGVTPDRSAWSGPAPLGVHVDSDRITTTRPIVLLEERIGTVTLVASRDRHYARLRRGLLVAGVVIATAWGWPC